MSQRRFLLTLIFASSSAALENIVCWNQQCDPNIMCNKDDDCVITCNQGSCKSKSIYCPLNGDCTIICKGKDACDSVHVYANSSNGNLDLICNTNTNFGNWGAGVSCNGIKVYGSTSSFASDQYHFNIACEACSTAEIYCAHATDCHILCNGASNSCADIRIHGPSYNELQLKCNGTNACLNAIVSAPEASNLSIEGCINPHIDSCKNLTIYCPSATDTKHCYLEGDNNLAWTQLYAIGGWNDININYFGEYLNNRGTMHCGSDYAISCDIMNNSWICARGLCAEQIIEETMSPTDIISTLSSTNMIQSYSAQTTENVETLLITDAILNVRDAAVKEYTTTMKYISTHDTIIESRNSDQGIMLTLLIILCAILACVVFVVISFLCVYCFKKPKQEIKKHVIVHHVNASSGSNTSTVVTIQSAPSMELSCIPEVIEGSLPAPGTMNSDDIVLDFNFSPQSMQMKKQMRLSTLSPSSYLSNISDNIIMDSVHLDDEVIGSDDEFDANNFQTPKGLRPEIERMQSEGGEQYHKLQHEILEAHPPTNGFIDEDVVTRLGVDQYQGTNMNVMMGEMDANEEYQLYMKQIGLHDDEVIMECATAIGENELVQIPVDNNHEDTDTEIGNVDCEPFVD